MSSGPKDRPGIGIVAQTPGSTKSQSGHIAVPMVLNTLLHFHDEIHLFTRATSKLEVEHSNVHIHKYSKPFADSKWYLRLIGQVIYQLKYSLGMARLRTRLDIVLFRGSGFIFPILTAKLLNITILSRVSGVIWRQEGHNSGSIVSSLWANFLKQLQNTIHRLADVLVLTSPHIADFADVQKFEDKICIWCHYYFDLEKFSVKTQFSERDRVVGQVAKLSEVKGSLTLINAMEGVQHNTKAKLLMVGDGPAFEEAKKQCKEKQLEAEFTGRIKRDNVPAEYNRMQLHVMNSVSEGLPKAAIEAMACGTPVLATAVGGLPDLIDHGQNGFLIDSNEEGELERGILEALKANNLEEMSQNSRQHIEENYSYESAIMGYYSMITEMTPHTLSEIPTDPEQPIHIP